MVNHQTLIIYLSLICNKNCIFVLNKKHYESYNLRKNSTREVTNMTSTWEFEIKMELIKTLKNY